MEQFPDDYECDGQIDIWEWIEEKESQSMTREETIKRVQATLTYMESLDADEEEQKDIEAYRMAIKVLEQEPCEDCISRAQALSDYADWYGYGYRDNTFYKHLKDMPPVTPQPKTGHWVSILNKKGLEIAVRCDCCGNSPKHAIRSDFCPNCGAKMVESQKSEGK